MAWFRRKRHLSRPEIDDLLVQRFGVGDAPRVSPWIMPAIDLRDGRLGREPKPLGTTRFGGRPDLPEDRAWPVGPDGPLAFLGQLSLAELSNLDLDGVLPKAGLLSFFFNITDYAWGSDLDDRQKFSVVYTDEGETLLRREFPSAIHSQNRLERSMRVTPRIYWQLPETDPLALQNIQVGDEPTLGNPQADPFTRAYWRLTHELVRPLIPIGNHQVLGWANGLYQQEVDVRQLCEAARNGFTTGSDNDSVIRERSAWRCLLQIDDKRALYDDTWGDGGSLAYFIREDDLARRDFDRCWVVLLTS